MLRLFGDFRCVAVDPPGIGLSASVPRASLTLENSARALNAVIQALDLTDYTLVMHDTGAPPAIAAASRAPGTRPRPTCGETCSACAGSWA